MTSKRSLGGPPTMWAGLIGLFLLATGTLIEQSWIANFLVQRDIGITLGTAGGIISLWGVASAVMSFFSGALYERLGARPQMLIGVILWLAAQALFLTVALPSGNVALITATYAIRGAATPLFVYSFYTWVLYRSDARAATKITGVVSFALTIGAGVVASLLAGVLLPVLGGVTLMWIGAAFVALAGVFGVGLVRYGAPEPHRSGNSAGKALRDALTLTWRMPEAGLGGLIKLIQGCSAGLAVFYVTYLATQFEFEIGPAVLIFTVIGVATIGGNLVWGWLADVVGWRSTVRWWAPALTASGYLLLFYVPTVTGTAWLPLLPGAILTGLGLAAFLPINAIVTSLTTTEKGGAVALLHVGLGAGGFVGPAVVGAVLAPFGYTGAIWVLVIIYLLPTVIMHFVRLPGNAKVATSTVAIPVDAR